MNRVAIGAIAVVAIVSVFLLLETPDEQEIKPIETTPLKESSETPSSSSNRVSITYEKSEDFKESKREEEVAKSDDTNLYIDRVITDNDLKYIAGNKSFRDGSGRYRGRLMVNYQAIRNLNAFPQIPIMAKVELPTGEKMSIQLDPNIAHNNDLIFLRVDDSKKENSMIYDITEINTLSTGAVVNIKLNSAGMVDDFYVDANVNPTESFPPAPPVN